jgi:hypothetical protein
MRQELHDQYMENKQTNKQASKQTNKQTTTTRKNDRHERRFHSIASTRNQCIPRFKNKTILSRLFNCAISSDYEFNSI